MNSPEKKYQTSSPANQVKASDIRQTANVLLKSQTHFFSKQLK